MFYIQPNLIRDHHGVIIMDGKFDRVGETPTKESGR